MACHATHRYQIVLSSPARKGRVVASAASVSELWGRRHVLTHALGYPADEPWKVVDTRTGRDLSPDEFAAVVRKSQSR